MPERHLKIGAWVETQLIPYYAYLQIGRSVQAPPPPQVGYKSAAGHTEYKTAPENSPEYREWQIEIAKVGVQQASLQELFTYNYAVKRWSWDEGTTWITEPPDDWQFPKSLEEFGIHPGPSRRADYIRYELLKMAEDLLPVQTDALGVAAPITNEEEQAALGGFRSDVQGTGAARKRRKAKR